MKKNKKQSSRKEADTYPDGIFQRLRLLTKAVELVHGVWQMTREAYESPLAGPKYWDVARVEGKAEESSLLSSRLASERAHWM